MSPALTALPSSLAMLTTTPSNCVETSTWCSTERTLRMSPELADFAGGTAGTAGAGADEYADVEPETAAGAPFGPEATGESPQPLAATPSALARIQIALLFMIVPLSYGNQAQA